MISIEAFRRKLYAAWAPPLKFNCSQWADEHFYLPEGDANAGKWRTLPYQTGIMNSFTDPTIERVTVMKSARVGYSRMVQAAIGYYIDHDPCPIMVVQPTTEDAEGYSKEDIAPMLQSSDVLKAKFPESKAKDSGNTILHKVFPGGVLSMVGANSPRGFRRVSRKVVIFEEPDGYPASAGPEGDPIRLGMRRTEYYWDRKIIMGGTPTLAGKSKTEYNFLLGDQRRYFVPCPHCQHMDFLSFREQNGAGHFMRWPKGKPLEAVFVCRGCGAEIEHKHKTWMIERGEWRATNPTPEILPSGSVHASFHIWAAYSYSPNATWGHIASEFVEAEQAGPGALQPFVNLTLGETWHEKGDAPEWQRLYDRRENYERGTVPDGGLFLVCGVDKQKDRLEWEVVAYGRGKRSWSVDYGIEMGDTHNLADPCWAKLAALLDRTWLHASGVPMQIAMMAVDSGDDSQTVYNWCRNFPMTRVAAVKGDHWAKILIGHPSPVDVNVNGKTMRRGYKVWALGVGVAKSELYGWLKMDKPTDEALESGAVYPPGYCHFPQYPEEFFKQLASEQLVTRKNKKGYAIYEWEILPGRRNERLDCRVYARAVAALVGLDRFNEDDWRALEAQLTPVEKKQQDTAGSSGNGRADGERGQSGSFIPRRPGWIRRDR